MSSRTTNRNKAGIALRVTEESKGGVDKERRFNQETFFLFIPTWKKISTKTSKKKRKKTEEEEEVEEEEEEE